jgi:uncharacterized protein YerC
MRLLGDLPGTCIDKVKSMEDEVYIYVLLADGDGTMRSIDEPFGVAVNTLEEAKRFKETGHVGYTHSYTRVRVFKNFEDGIKWKYPIPPNGLVNARRVRRRVQPVVR